MNHFVKISKILTLAIVFMITLVGTDVTTYAVDLSLPQIDVSIGATDDPLTLAPTLQLFFLISVITLAPTLLLMLTGFTRIIVVLHFLRSAMGTQQMPPNQVLIGLALFLTLFLMNPILTEINENALIPYTSGQITQQEAIERGFEPLQRFMLDQVTTTDLALFVQLAGGETFETEEDVPARILIPAFILGELTQGFIIGFILYLPFIVIDMIVASVLMAMGMMMLPPAMISLPFKILLFILGGGWTHVLNYVMMTFRVT
ncbi:MAG: flagellar type III secretion system pore protein FliP [Defluviitaleaceae bacterium]|nr:flagellar type III secretion system pore protein FliP [Defluviitaleaceae bacterium]